MNAARSARTLAAGILLLQPFQSMAQQPIPQGVQPSQSIAPADAEFLLRSLGVGAPRPVAGGLPAARTMEMGPRRMAPANRYRDAPVTLREGASAPLNLSVGSAKLLILPSDFDRATLVIPDIAEIIVLSQSRVQVMARQPGSTDIVFTNTLTGASFRAHVVVSLDASPVQAAISAAMPRERITATSINNSIVLEGTVHDVATANQALALARRFVADPANGVVSNIRVLGAQQVMLQVRVAEVNRSFMKQLGMNSSVRFKSGSLGNSVLSSSNSTQGIGPASLFGDTLSTIANPVGFLSTRALGGILNTTLSALESDSMVKLIAEPNLVAMSGQTANFLAGQQYPIPVVGLNGTGGTEYRNFGVSLAFTPTVMSPDNIALQILTEVSTKAENVAIPSGGGTAQVPVFNTRRATTTVELPSGGSLAIAGLIQSDFQHSMSGLPGIRNIPILGRLFSSSDFQRNETELVIIVTPYLVEPTSAGTRLGSPTDGVLPPSDADMLFLSRLTGAMSRRPTSVPTALSRNTGFITE